MDFSLISIGKQYGRPKLARLWGYETYNAISRGVVTPKRKPIIVLFVTREKQEHLTQYEDHIEQDILFWEGEQKHGSDQRITERRDTIHVFFRERHHMPFTYQGRAALMGYKLYRDRPSKFTFHLVDREVTSKLLVEEVRADYNLSESERQAIIKSRVGQGVYRERCISLWNTCSVTGFTKSNILIASHVKPWKVSSNQERIDPFNSLLLVPSLDKLFDKGYIGFVPDGRILISDKISQPDLTRIGVHPRLRLREVPRDLVPYLEYHAEYRFDLLRD